MILKITRTNRFKKDYKLMKKRNRDMKKLDYVIEKLAGGFKLEERYKDYMLIGIYQNRRECHIEPDWLLIYKKEKDEIIFERTGSHSELVD